MSVEIMTELLEAGVHYGHQTKRWNPKMKDFILEEKNSIYIIDLSKTIDQLRDAGNFLSKTAQQGGKILFVGCKKQAQEAVKEAAEACGQFYVNQRWLGGTLTNLVTIRKSVKRLREFEELEKSPGFHRINKAEASALRREATKIRKNLCGVLTMEKLPDVLVIIDTVRESIAVAEARRLGIPIVAIVDTNSDPEVVNYPIAGNDDAIRAIRIILQKLVDGILAGRGSRQQMPMALPEASLEPIVLIEQELIVVEA
ncbi:MAG: 30S ribosomal protein S2 [Verrucomicrobiae bacterium]|nr:30S ribosomal protein S2 [Verrucomicrobiae bacterium]